MSQLSRDPDRKSDVMLQEARQPQVHTALSSRDHTGTSAGETQLSAEKRGYVLSMGPQHPSTHGVLRMEVVCDGEVVIAAKPDIGYLHRCKEKIGESESYIKFTPYTDRLDYLASMNQNHGYCIAVERLAGIEVPERAEYIRVIVAELNRIASHLVSFGTYGLDLGAFTPFLYAFREREKILDIFEHICGARLTYAYVYVGGVMRDITPEHLGMIEEFLNYVEPKIDEYDRLLSYNQIFIKRTANVGPLSAELAKAYGVTGPVLRASGVDWDLRRDDPYSIYDRFDWNVVVGQGDVGQVGDSWDRYIVRLREIRESVKIVRQAIAQVPKGPCQAPAKAIKSRLKYNEVYCRTEAPRGELGFYLVADGGPNHWRCKVRAPSFSNLSVIEELAPGLMIADLVAVLGSIDVVMGDVDR